MMTKNPAQTTDETAIALTPNQWGGENPTGDSQISTHVENLLKSFPQMPTPNSIPTLPSGERKPRLYKVHLLSTLNCVSSPRVFH